MSLKAGKEALANKRYTEAIAILLEYCQDLRSQTQELAQQRQYIQAQMWLASAYQHTGRADKAIAICEKFIDHGDPHVQTWAIQALKTANLDLLSSPSEQPAVSSVIKSKPNRYRKPNVTLSLEPSTQLLFIYVILAK